ncbi:MAG: endonuclease/exonuclease/phosphatase family protein [Vicingaceae bacterium]
MKKGLWFSRAFLALNLISGILLLLSISSLYIDPRNWVLPSLLGLGFLQLFTLNFFLFICSFLINKKYIWLSLIFMVFGLTELPSHLEFNIDEEKRENDISILSLNVRNFDLYNWSENKKTRDRIMRTILRAKSDIICLQEFFNTTDPNHDFKTLETILEFKKKYSAHVEYTATVKNTEHWGIATFSSFPIVGKGSIKFQGGSNNVCIYTDLFVDLDTLRVYNTHLASVHLGKDDYNYLNDVGNELNQDVDRMGTLLKKLSAAYVIRAQQAAKVKEHMRNSPYPVILCGDFNDTPTSYTYRVLSDEMNDSFRKKGNGFGATYNGKLPFLRIDYILADGNFDLLSHEVMHSDISDHYPVKVRLGLRSDL